MMQSVSSGAFLADVHRAAKHLRAARSNACQTAKDGKKGEAKEHSAGVKKKGNAKSKAPVLPVKSASLAQMIGEEVVSLLERNVRGLGSLPKEAGLYWLNTSHLEECGIDDGIPDDAIDRLCAIYEFLTGGNPSGLSSKDWKELSLMADDAAEDIPIDGLAAMMSILLEHGAIS